ncbi:hypothetical protein [Reyranella soli]|uniref:Uncharacterized protein n=1 Tax=Reyranella soli TaxID=1230389 RepID=A0A512NCN8_9HYPH|nr:hypothetical protein [Reyranella soli]GEP56710.1 hypothetical protein RSO01_38760 [Reyranella soli]
MSTSPYPSLLVAPTTPHALPCFRLSDGMQDLQSAFRRPLWDTECASILVECADRCTNAEIADLIAARTGMRFKPKTVSDRRAALGLGAPGRNDWTSPLRRLRPWQGG